MPNNSLVPESGSTNPVHKIITTIASGTSLGDSIVLSSLRLFGLVMPSAWDAAAITFQASFDGGTTWQDIYDANGIEITAIAAANHIVMLDPVVFMSVPMIKLRSGTGATPVNQSANRSISLILRSA